jgi:hypothetical protein
MDIVCPVIERDFERFQTLFRSLEKFCIDPFKLYLVSDTGDSPIYDPKIIPIKETKLDRSLSTKRFNGKGWWKQQIIKLLSFKFCNTPHILSLDADCFAVKPFSFSEFVSHKKIKTKVSSSGSWDNWYIGSSSILKLGLHPDYRNNRIGVTPFIFSNKMLEGLNKYLKTLYKNPTATMLDNTHIFLENNTDKNITNSTAVWSEYCVYHIYGLHTGFWNKYHHDSPNFNLYGNSFWNSEDVKRWDASKSFYKPKFYFTVAQSVSGQSASWVEEQIRLYV